MLLDWLPENKDEKKFIAAVVSITFFLIFLIVVIIIAVIKYQNRIKYHSQQVRDLEYNYQQEILKAQLEVQEQTIGDIAREIHDNIGQILSLIRLNMSTINVEEAEPAKRKIITSKELLDQAIEDLRNLAKRLNAEFVGRQKLSESLRLQLEALQKTEIYHTTLEVHGDEVALPAEKKLILVRIVQEALNNIIKHAEAKNISVLLMYLPDKLILSLKDDGRGFDLTQNADNGTGTINMAYRAKLIGAIFSVQSKPGEGTLIQIVLPLP